MYTVAPIATVSRIATEALIAYRIVIYTASDDTAVEYPAAEYDGLLAGITLHDAALGEQVEVCTLGPCLLKVDGNAANIVARDWIVNHTADGYGRKVGSTANTVYPYVGYALGAATADGAIIPVFVLPGQLSTAT
jgi:hypothetical protein